MPCSWYKTADGWVVHINHGRGGGKKKLCPFCKRGSVSKLCDFPVGLALGATCDAEMCDACSRTLGYQDTEVAHGLKLLNDTLDVCPNHHGKEFPKEAAHAS